MRVERQKCRRADNMIFGSEKGGRDRDGLRRNLDTANLHPLLRVMRLRANDRLRLRVATAKAEASRRTPPTCKQFAKCRRADNFQKWKMEFGVPA
jgi:hypothetical protein